jgi:transposase
MQEVARQFKASWHNVLSAVAMAVARGRERMDLSEISAIGVDEIHWSAKRGFMTLVYQIDNHCKRLLWCGEDRTEKTITAFFDWFGEERSAKLLFVCSDMWKPYLKLIALRAKSALNILDRFHIAKKLGDAIDDVRVAETKELMRQGKNVLLKYSRWCFLKNPENLTENQKVKLRDLLKCNLKTIRAYLLKEDFQAFWDYVSDLRRRKCSKYRYITSSANFRSRNSPTNIFNEGKRREISKRHGAKNIVPPTRGRGDEKFPRRVILRVLAPFQVLADFVSAL